MLEFWRLIGFDRVEAPEVLGDSVVWVEREGTQIHLILTEGHAARSSGTRRSSCPITPRSRRALREAGFEVEEARQLWGADRAFALAPGGHRVELMAAPPPRRIGGGVRPFQHGRARAGGCYR